MQVGKKNKDREKKHAEANVRKKLGNVRVIQRNLVYVTNLVLSAATEETLKRDYFGRFGRIKKVVVNRNNVYQGPQGPSVCAYITYYRNKDAHDAIKAVDGTVLDGRLLRASFGTTKYCSYFLRNVRCPNPDCMYLHELGAEVDSFTKEDMAQGKHLLTNITFDDEEDSGDEDKDGYLYQGSRKSELSRSSPLSKPKQQQVAWKTVSNGAPADTHSTPSLASSLNPDEWPDPLSMRDTKQGTPTRSKPNNSSQHQSAYLAAPMQETFADSNSSQDDDNSEDSPRGNSGSNSGVWDSKNNSQEDLEDQHSGRQSRESENSRHMSSPEIESPQSRRKNHLTPKKQTEWRKIQTKPQNQTPTAESSSPSSPHFSPPYSPSYSHTPSNTASDGGGLVPAVATAGMNVIGTPGGYSNNGRDSGSNGDNSDDDELKENQRANDYLNVTIEILRSPEKARTSRAIPSDAYSRSPEGFRPDFRHNEVASNANWGKQSSETEFAVEQEQNARDMGAPWRGQTIDSTAKHSLPQSNNYGAVFGHVGKSPESAAMGGGVELEEWLRVKFTDLLLDENATQNGKYTPILDMVWSENLPIFPSSSAGKSRFTFAQEVEDSEHTMNRVDTAEAGPMHSFPEFKPSSNPLHVIPKPASTQSSRLQALSQSGHLPPRVGNFNHSDEDQNLEALFSNGNSHTPQQRVLQKKPQQRVHNGSNNTNNGNVNGAQFFPTFDSHAPPTWPSAASSPISFLPSIKQPQHKSMIPGSGSRQQQQHHSPIIHHGHSPSSSKGPRGGSNWGQPSTTHAHVASNNMSNGNGFWGTPTHASMATSMPMQGIHTHSFKAPQAVIEKQY